MSDKRFNINVTDTSYNVIIWIVAWLILTADEPDVLDGITHFLMEVV